jgi:hypothetical protein
MRADALVRAQNVTAKAQQRPALQVSGIGWAGRRFSSSYYNGDRCSTNTNWETSTIDYCNDCDRAWLPCITERHERYVNAYLQVDMGHDCGGCSKTVFGVVTQGRSSNTAFYQRVLLYRIQITNDPEPSL